MTAIRRRRTRATLVAYLAVVVGVVAVAGLSVAGLGTLADSTAGQRAADDGQAVFSQRLPYTATSLLGVADEDGRLTSLVVAVLESDGTGGSVVQLPVSAEPSSGNADELAPLDAVLEVAGPIAFREAVERLTGLSFDVIEIADQERFAQLITPLGDMTVDLPDPVVDTSSEETWEAGEQLLTAPGAARLVTAVTTSVPAWAHEPVRSAVWTAVAERVGAGIGSATPVAADTDLPVPGSTDEFLDRLFAGPVGFRTFQYRPVDADEAEADMGAAFRDPFGPEVPVSVVLLDRAEMILVFGGVAPSRLGAPLDAPTFRIVSGFTDADTEPLGMSATDVVKIVVNVMIFTKVNVVSVAQLDDVDVPDVTQILVADPTLTDDQLREVYEPQFGPVEIVPAAIGIDGIDAEIVLGRTLLDRLAEDVESDSAVDVAGSGGDADDDSDEDSGDTGDGDG